MTDPLKAYEYPTYWQRRLLELLVTPGGHLIHSRRFDNGFRQRWIFDRTLRDTGNRPVELERVPYAPTFHAVARRGWIEIWLGNADEALWTISDKGREVLAL